MQVAMSRNIAHSFKDLRIRTEDVVGAESMTFNSFLLKPVVLDGLETQGFQKPSPVQLKALPLGRLGFDLIVQAKSGTGKTCVFVVIALESLKDDCPGTQVLVLAPTREIAVQNAEVTSSIGCAMKDLSVHVFIGGLPIHEDKKKLKKCQVAVGSPGRIKQLIEEGHLKTEAIRLFVLDEADKLLEEGFQEQINWIYSCLPYNKQVLALSATYPQHLADHLKLYMRNPMYIRLNIHDPALLGICQYYKEVSFNPVVTVAFNNKQAALIELLKTVNFDQCLVFSNYQLRSQSLAQNLEALGWTTSCISGSQDQHTRLNAMSKLKQRECRILVTTDLTSRGIDAAHVNLIVNLDIPIDAETYLHRVGRAGRFGTFAAAVTILCGPKDMIKLEEIKTKCHVTVERLPDDVPVDLVDKAVSLLADNMIVMEQIKSEPPPPDPPLINPICPEADLLYSVNDPDAECVSEQTSSDTPNADNADKDSSQVNNRSRKHDVKCEDIINGIVDLSSNTSCASSAARAESPYSSPNSCFTSISNTANTSADVSAVNSDICLMDSNKLIEENADTVVTVDSIP